MEGPPRYQVLSREDEDEIQAQLQEKDGTEWNANDTEIIPTNTRSFIFYLSLLLLSLSANVLLVMDNAKLRVARNHDKTAFSGLAFDTPKPYHAMSEFWHSNSSDSSMEAAWDAINTNPIAVAVHDDFAKRASLPPTTRFPWDTERSVYYLKGLHDLHCLVCCCSFDSSHGLMLSETHSQSHCNQAQQRQHDFQPQSYLPLSRWFTAGHHVCSRRHAHAGAV